MQLSELYRRGIVVPVDDIAEKQLRTFDIDEGLSVIVLHIADQTLFEILWDSGIFLEINRKCNAMLGDYECGFVEHYDSNNLIGAIDKIGTNSSQNAQTITFLSELRNLANKASDLQRPVLFVL